MLLCALCAALGVSQCRVISRGPCERRAGTTRSHARSGTRAAPLWETWLLLGLAEATSNTSANSRRSPTRSTPTAAHRAPGKGGAVVVGPSCAKNTFAHLYFFQLLASVTRKPKASLERPKHGKGLRWRSPPIPMEVHPSKPDTPLPDPAPRQALEATQPLLRHALPPQQGDVSNMRRVLRDGGPIDLKVATALTAEGGVGSRQGLVRSRGQAGTNAHRL